MGQNPLERLIEALLLDIFLVDYSCRAIPNEGKF